MYVYILNISGNPKPQLGARRTLFEGLSFAKCLAVASLTRPVTVTSVV